MIGSTPERRLISRLRLLLLFISASYPVSEAEEMTIPQNSKLCPDSPVDKGVIYSYHNDTKSCFRIGSKGPCGESMIFFADPENADLGQCDCDISKRCNRPLVYWNLSNRCYRIFEQGPCGPEDWLTLRNGRVPVCERNPCQARSSEFEPQNPAEFWIYHGNQCVLSGSYGFCRYGNEKIFLNGFSRSVEPICSAVTYKCELPSDPCLVCAPGQKWHQDGCEPEGIMDGRSSTVPPFLPTSDPSGGNYFPHHHHRRHPHHHFHHSPHYHHHGEHHHHYNSRDERHWGRRNFIHQHHAPTTQSYQPRTSFAYHPHAFPTLATQGSSSPSPPSLRPLNGTGAPLIITFRRVLREQ